MTTSQTPIGSGFGKASTADEVIAGIDLTGKTAIVTGGYSGLGLETVRVFLAAGARVIVPTRDVGRAKAALTKFAAAEIWPMDLLDPASIDAFVQRFLAEGTPLHILVNSAGIMALPELTLDGRGHELQFATNHLGHFQLTLRLWPALQAAHGARVVAVSSLGHRFSPVVFDDIDFRHRPYSPFAAYAQSKTANALFAVELDKRGMPDGIRAFAVHPGGIVETNLGKHIDPAMLRDLGAIDAEGKAIIAPERGFKTPSMGAATQVWCATSPQLIDRGGVYCEDCDVSAPLAPPEGEYLLGDTLGQGGVFPHAVDPVAAEKLWTLSEDLTGVRFPA
ncbi:2,3-dihydro-2,3-dihydroxybenzoate dehydrogenase [mine drainage metagenome]|uniref:2,3-dihydro-2,3-dihydroxybenzoate dehydrogenase n=1 Tax=mine drainage metagenome TaxID=410659 RepID=A0A1J5RCM4_9ZZZZ